MGVGWHMLYVLLLSVAVGLYETFAVPRGLESLAVEGLGTPFGMITFVLSLLLVFKTNSSYSRWWEGRIVWGAVVNYMRNLTRQAVSYMTAPEDKIIQV